MRRLKRQQERRLTRRWANAGSPRLAEWMSARGIPPSRVSRVEALEVRLGSGSRSFVWLTFASVVDNDQLPDLLARAAEDGVTVSVEKEK